MRGFRIIFKKSRLAAALCMLFIMCSFATANASANTGNASADTANTGNKLVRAGVFYFDGYHMKDEDGNMTGYGIEFLEMASKYSRLNFEYAGYERSWNDMLVMLENGEIDIVTSARKTPEREEKFAFSLPIGRNSTVISIRTDDERFHSGDYKSYDGMKIGVITGSSQNQGLAKFAAEKGFSYQAVDYSDTEKMVKALKDGTIDAILSSNLRKTEGEKTLDTLMTENFYAIVRKKDAGLLEEINYAIGQMDINEGDWTHTVYYKHYGPAYSSELAFTNREKEYIQDVISGKKKITVTSAGDCAPYSYEEAGELKGIMPDYFAEVMALTGMPYETIVPKDRDDYSKLADTNGVDVVIDKKASEAAAGGSEYHGFDTDTYISVGVAKVTRKDFSGDVKTVAIADAQSSVLSEKGLVEDEAIRKYVTTEEAPGTDPFLLDEQFSVLKYATREEALKAVLDGKADAAYVYTYTAQMFINDDYTNSLNYSMVNGIRFEFQMYVRDSADHELVTILNKCIHQIPEDALNHLVTKYTAYSPKELTLVQYMRIHSELMIASILVIMLILGVIMVLILRMRWTRKLLGAVEQSNIELGEQLDIVEALSREYLNVYSVNTRDGTAKIIKLEGYVPTGLQKESEEEFPYNPTMSRYIRDRVHPEDKESLAEALALEKVAEKMDSDAEYTGGYRILADGEIHNFQFTYVKLKGSSPKEGFTVLAGFRNIDEMVRKEQEQKKMLEKALAEAHHANHAKTTFLNNMSHDIRTPMNAIIGFTSLAASHIESRDLVKNYLDKILTSSKHLLSLINDVLDMSRIESGKVRIEEKENSLPEIMHDLKTIVQSDVKAKQLDFYIDTLNVVNETIICDKLRLSQVLLNILSNAMKYTKPGGRVSVRIIQNADAPDGYGSYRFEIKDTGIGMSAGFLEHLFEPFEREQTATVSGIQGTGLGLAITKNIIDMMHGTVEVKSELGKGTEFIVTFSFRVAKRTEKSGRVDELAGLHALIVDDDINNCVSVSKMLSSLGMRPDWTTHGSEAAVRAKFAMEQNAPYSVYVVDWMMPDVNGVEVIRRIRRTAGDEAVIIMLTACDWADIEEEAREAGVTAFCSKPIFLSELQGVLMNLFTETPEEIEEDEQEDVFTGKRILLAEDNEINQEIANEILTEAGFIIDIVDDGTKAVDKIAQMPCGTYDMVLMDIQMPVMDGYEATKRIRNLEDPARSSVPIVAMTANAFDEDRKRALDAGMNGHVSKPIDISNLMETLKDILKKNL